MNCSLATRFGQPESIGGMGVDGRTLWSPKQLPFLNTLYTMGPSPSRT